MKCNERRDSDEAKRTKCEWWDAECRTGVSWMETVVTQSGQCGSGGGQHDCS